MWIGKSVNRICYEERVRLGKKNRYIYNIFILLFIVLYLHTVTETHKTRVIKEREKEHKQKKEIEKHSTI